MRARLVPSLVLIAAALAPAPAEAGVATTIPRTEYDTKTGEYTVMDLNYVAGSGERNVVSITPAGPDGFRVQDEAGVSAGAGCRATGAPTVVLCGVTAGGQVNRLELGDEDDFVDTRLGAAVVDAGPGDDRVQMFGVSVLGGEGADVLRGGRMIDGGPGADDMTGQAVTYADRTGPVSADLEGDTDDGAPGEGDRISSTVREVVGGGGDDRLVGSGGDDVLDGGAGADLLVGADGADRLDGGRGLDAIDAGGGDDALKAGPNGEQVEGVEKLSGGMGRDVLSGTAGRQRLDGGTGMDTIEGGGGGDLVPAADGELDLIGCSVPPITSGHASLDRLDLARGCASTTRTGPGAPRLLVLGQTDTDRDGLVRVGVGCSQDQQGGCPVQVRLRRGRRLLATRRIVVAPGTAKLVRPEVPRRFARTARSCADLNLTVDLSTRTMTGRPRRIRAPYQFVSLALECDNDVLVAIGPDAGW